MKLTIKLHIYCYFDLSTNDLINGWLFIWCTEHKIEESNFWKNNTNIKLNRRTKIEEPSKFNSIWFDFSKYLKLTINWIAHLLVHWFVHKWFNYWLAFYLVHRNFETLTRNTKSIIVNICKTEKNIYIHKIRSCLKIETCLGWLSSFL